MQVSEGASRKCQDKIGRWRNPDKWTKSKCHGKLSYKQLHGFSKAMKPNGPAIWGGCVTRRSIRAVPSTRDGTLARKLSRCKEGMARVFAVMAQILTSAGAVAVQV